MLETLFCSISNYLCLNCKECAHCLISNIESLYRLQEENICIYCMLKYSTCSKF